jgi:hypothetical protein
VLPRLRLAEVPRIAALPRPWDDGGLGLAGDGVVAEHTRFCADIASSRQGVKGEAGASTLFETRLYTVIPRWPRSGHPGDLRFPVYVWLRSPGSRLCRDRGMTVGKWGHPKPSTLTFLLPDRGGAGYPPPRRPNPLQIRTFPKTLSAPLPGYPILLPFPRQLEARTGYPGVRGLRSSSGLVDLTTTKPGVAIGRTAAQSSTVCSCRFRDGAGNGSDQISVCEVPPAPPTQLP